MLHCDASSTIQYVRSKLFYAIYVSHVRRREFQIIIFEKVAKRISNFFYSQFHWRREIESPYGFERER